MYVYMSPINVLILGVSSGAFFGTTALVLEKFIIKNISMKFLESF